MPIVRTSFGQGIGEKIAGEDFHPVFEAAPAERAFGNRFHGGQVEGGAVQMRMTLRNQCRQDAGRPADVAQALIGGEIEFLGEGREVGVRDAGHRVEELLQAVRVCVGKAPSCCSPAKSRVNRAR